MARARAFAATLVAASLSACGTIPGPETVLPAGNAQVRLTEATGIVEAGSGRLLATNGEGRSCILTTLGELPAGEGELVQGGCRFAFVGSATDAEQ